MMKTLLWKARTRMLGPGIVRNVNGTRHGRAALLLYRVAAFQAPDASPHQNGWQSRELAAALGELGYDVDVVDFDERRRELLASAYQLVIDLHPRRMPLYQERLGANALRIAYITGCNPAFGNREERARLDALEQRRGVRLAPRRQVPPFEQDVLGSFDAMMIFGSRFTLATYAEFTLPPFHVLPNNGFDDVPVTDPAERDPRRFLYLASYGQVHKGLDRLLEAFAREPSLHLVVCSPYEKEPDFVRAYRRELLEAPNVHAAGFTDVRSRSFAALQAGCGAMILPSCSEAQCGAVTAAASFGVPILMSEGCGFDEPGFERLADCEIDSLAAAVRAWAAQSRADVAARSRATTAVWRARYRPAHYAAAVRSALRAILERAGAEPRPR
jgi:glycosyltransferase involved in cell wall biosynthesis